MVRLLMGPVRTALNLGEQPYETHSGFGRIQTEPNYGLTRFLVSSVVGK
jgi:hypothetical protein